MEITKISSKGQIVIPQKIRNNLGIKKGSLVGIEQVNDMFLVKKIDTNLVNQFEKSLQDLKKGKIKRVA